MLHTLAVVSLSMAVLCAFVLVIDVARHRQKMAIMNVVWPITALYFGPFAVWMYWAFGRNAGKQPDKPFWQQVWTGVTHCGAGCTIGDAVAEWVVFALGLTLFRSKLGTDYLFDFVLAYVVGIIFQYFSIAPMRNLSGWPGIKAAIKADTISLIAFEVGMFAFMAWTSQAFHPKLEPNDARYWFLMQVAMIVGFFTSYPANWWLIRQGWKEAM